MSSHKIYSNLDALEERCRTLQQQGKTIVFTNGCFDILHVGHVSYLEEAKSLGDVLILGLNADASVKRLKGDTRPINTYEDRAKVLAGLSSVDCIISFEEDTPLPLITRLVPNILVKGGDYILADIVGAKEVIAAGGEVKVLRFVEGKSSSVIIDKIKSL